MVSDGDDGQRIRAYQSGQCNKRTYDIGDFHVSV